MTWASPLDRPVAEATVPNGNVYRISDYVGSAFSAEPVPQVYLVEFPVAHGTIRPHFHKTNQFQVVVRGGGRLGKHPLSPVAVHYTDAFTPYGPIVTDDDGIAFFTIRAEGDTGSEYMPESRDKLERKAGRGLAWHVAPTSGPPTATAVQPVEPPYADGLSVAVASVAPGDRLDLQPHDAGRICILIGGSVTEQDGPLPLFSCRSVSPGETLAVAAEADGASVLVLDFPRGASAR